jgi:hypothetical protein
MKRFAIVFGVIAALFVAVLIAGNSHLLAENNLTIRAQNATTASGSAVTANAAIGDTEYFFYADGYTQSCNGSATIYFQAQQSPDSHSDWQNATSFTLSSGMASGSFTARARALSVNGTSMTCGSDGSVDAELPVHFYSWGGND